MPRPLGYERRDAKKLEARRFAAVARLKHGESTAAVAALPGRMQTVRPAMGSIVSLARRARLASPAKGRRSPPEAGPRQTGAAPEPSGAGTFGPWL